MIAPNVVITCAHNVFLKDQRTGIAIKAFSVLFYPGKAGNYALGRYEGK